MKAKIQKVDAFFQALNIKEQDVKGDQKKELPIPEKSFNSRGEEMLTPRQIR